MTFTCRDFLRWEAEDRVVWGDSFGFERLTDGKIPLIVSALGVSRHTDVRFLKKNMKIFEPSKTKDEFFSLQ